VTALDEPVDRLLPELSGRQVLRRIDGPLDDTTPAVRAITVRDLLTFTFGFVAAVEMFFTDTPWPVMEATDALRLGTLGPPDPATQPDPDTWIAGLSTLPLLAQPGERWLYNTGASVLGVLIARAAGLFYPEFLRSRIFEPLGMRDTAFFTTDTGRLATSYRGTPGGLVVCYGWDGGLGTSWLVDPGHDLVVVMLTQLMFEGGQTPQAHEDIRAAAYAALG
jgi:CubicO group peptidase (beta-lactamase class C family)